MWVALELGEISPSKVAAFIVERTFRSCPWHVIGNFKFSTPEETGTKRQLLRSDLFLASSLAEVLWLSVFNAFPNSFGLVDL